MQMMTGKFRTQYALTSERLLVQRVKEYAELWRLNPDSDMSTLRRQLGDECRVQVKYIHKKIFLPIFGSCIYIVFICYL